ncbi:MAG: glycosyltransferase [Lachnospiraceae bacterium]|nr:glycosyltransferase [Lachnospiraceae bacterium]
MEPLVSIIVPVYNAKDYIGRCVDSILNQEYQKLEILLVDDGSEDGTGALLDEYAARDRRVRVIHQENAGVSASRNRALDLAQGEYVQFADSDDWLTPDSTKLLTRPAIEKGCDLVIGDFYRVTGKRLSQKGDIDADHVMDRREFASYMIENPADFYYGVLWNKLFRRSIIEEHQIRMDEELSWCEDFLFNLEYIRYAGAIYAVQAPVYYYMKRKDSLVSQGISISNTVKMKSTVFDYYNAFYRDVYEEDYAEVKQKVRMFLISTAWDGFVMPSVAPGTSKLGEESLRLAGRSVSETRGVLADVYYFGKLLEYQLGLAAMLRQITPEDALLLLLFENVRQFTGRREMAELAGLNVQKASRALSRLKREKLIDFELDSEEGLVIELLDKAADYTEEINRALEECKKVCLKGFSADEAEQAEAFAARLNENIRAKLEKVSWPFDTDAGDMEKDEKKAEKKTARKGGRR